MSDIVVDRSKVPWWVSNVIVPLVNLMLALLVSGLFVFINCLLDKKYLSKHVAKYSLTDVTE